MPITVVVINWNHAAVMGACLDALLAQQGVHFEILVIDNHSTDGSAEKIVQAYPSVRMVRNAENVGFARAFNQALALSHSDWLLSLNPDVTVRPAFLKSLLHAACQEDRIGMAAPKLLQAADPSRYDSTGLFLDSKRHPYDRGQAQRDDGQFDAQTEIFGACGGAALYRRAMLQDVAVQGEALDADFFAYMEDADLAWRAQLRGWRAIYAPLAVAEHIRGSGDRLRRTRRSGRGPRLALANRYLMIVKNDTCPSFLKALPAILAAEIPRHLYALWANPQMWLGWLDFLRKLPAARRKRAFIQARRAQQVDF